MAKRIEESIARTFLDLAEGLETGSLGGRPRIALAGLGSEHGEDTVLAGAVQAAKAGIDVYYIGTQEHAGVTTVPAADADECHRVMEDLLDRHDVDGAVTLHYPFPIGVSTVGRAVTPGRGKDVFIATTTGTSSTQRVEGMVKNAIYGIITAKACGIAEPTVGILNVDGARHVEKALKDLAMGGYAIHFAESSRSDGGCIMRGNDLLEGTADVMVTDSLTGNILIKMLSAYTTGGNYESLGYGYGPGIGEGYDKLILIISRVSGSPLIAGALQFAGELVQNHVFDVAAREFAAAKSAGLDQLLAACSGAPKQESAAAVAAPPKEVVTAQIAGIEVLDLEDAVQVLWKQGIYAESGMGCTGPIIRVSEANYAKSYDLLKQAGYCQ